MYCWAPETKLLGGMAVWTSHLSYYSLAEDLKIKKRHFKFWQEHTDINIHQMTLSNGINQGEHYNTISLCLMTTVGKRKREREEKGKKTGFALPSYAFWFVSISIIFGRACPKSLFELLI